MARWKLLRQDYGSDEYTYFEGNEVTVGRDPNNTVSLKSLVISRNHCIFSFKKDEVFVTDLKSANGVYVGKNKITPNVPFSIHDSDIIGLGWTYGVQGNIQDNQKFIYKLIKDKKLAEKIKFEKLDELDIIEAEIANINKEYSVKSSKLRSKSPVLETRQPIKRKLQLKYKDNKENILSKNNETKCFKEDSVVVVSDEGDENKIEVEGVLTKKIKTEPDVDNIAYSTNKTENDKLECEAFDIKQEYLGYDDEAIVIESDDDSESEKWVMRLSQSSPGKPFEKIKERLKTPTKDSSYSQLEDEIFDDDDQDMKQRSESENDEIMDDLITIPQSPPNEKTEVDGSFNVSSNLVSSASSKRTEKEIDSVNTDIGADAMSTTPANDMKKIQIIEPLKQPSRKQAHAVTETKTKISSKSTHHSRSKKSSKSSTSTRRSISNSQKEERKKRLKDLANKEKDEVKTDKNFKNNLTHEDNANKPIINVKVTSSNRGAFLTNEDVPVKPVTKKDTSTKHKHQTQHVESHGYKLQETSDKLKKSESSKSKTSHHSQKSSPTQNKPDQNNLQDSTKYTILGNNYEQSKKPVSVVGPSPAVPLKKKVRFSDKLPLIHEFQIEPGNRMKKTSSAKTAFMDRVPNVPVYSLKNVTLMKILRWNTLWLSEQTNNVEPPPILGHNNVPMALFHSFESHDQYVEMVGDLLLMEIWECLSQAYLKECNTNSTIPFQIESLPPVPPQERYFELVNINVNVSFPSSNTKLLPRVGEVLTMEFGPEGSKTCRFFYVHNVRTLPSPPNNKFSYFSISLHGTFTEKMKSLRAGELIKGKKLAYINKELSLFEAMENLARSDLCEAILKPKPHHFPAIPNNPSSDMFSDSKWTINLNPSQKLAVCSTVSAALGTKPSIQMVQGPPGTGKSSVICAIVMSYLYGPTGARLAGRGKILICATSNAAVDELVIRLLNIRRDLSDRFRLVRVGRWEAMHARARTVSSQELAQRDARAHAHPHSAALDTEISYQIAKINMWNTNLREAKDPERVAYCEGRVAHYTNRLTMLQAGGGGGAGVEPRREQLQQSERRIIECADVIVTTLSSAASPKMKGIKERVALCIVDEAGQAIEPEALVPLTLGVARLSLVGDPQQLPGYICSQRAKKHGLGESLFSRLSSVAEVWGRTPVVLLDRQYRMHAAIADYPNRAFYGGLIQTPPRVQPDLPVPPYCVVDVASGDKGQAASGANETEAWGVSRVASALAAAVRARRLSVAVITPYAAQRDLLLRCLRELHDGSAADIEVNTVDSFQGQERDVVVVSLARSHGVGFLSDAGRMCVMLTRARHALLVCLNPMALVRNQQWRTLIEDAQRRKLFASLPKRICQPASAETIPNEQTLECLTRIKQKFST